MEELLESVAWLKARGITDPEVGIVLGTGLHELASKIEVEKVFTYNVIPNFPIATVEFHFGRLIYGTLNGKKVLACQGRFHYYEGYDMHQVVMPVRVMKMLGVKHVLLSNAAGAVNLAFKKGSLMMVDDHINLQPQSPLIGQNLDELGPRFPDMSQPYSAKLNGMIREIARKKGIELNEGVYVSVPGPNLETRAEYRYLRMIGADAVGMSTVPEVIACNHMSLPCCCISVITDECDPDNLKPVSIEEIIAIARKSETVLTELYTELIGQL
ncbi:MAG: purine-nucleoside phosphorylase [Flavobacteriales bacterium]|jgi:purine-nucleoside phosphorylase